MPVAGHRSWVRTARWLVGPAILALLLAAVGPYAALSTHEGGTHSGRAIALQADATVGEVAAAGVIVCDTGELDETGTPPRDCEVVEADVDEGPLSLTASLISGETTGTGASSESTSTIERSRLTVGETIDTVTDPLLEVAATLIESTATASCDNGDVVLGGDTTITELDINLLGQDVAVNVDAEGAQQFTVGTVTLTVVVDDRDTNTEAREGGEYGDITVTALRISLSDTATDTNVDLRLAEAYADIFCAEAVVPPTAPPTEPPATEPPATEPPATEPPATEPPATEPPATEPPAPQAPATAEPTATLPDTVASPTPDSSQGNRGSLFLLLLLGTAIGAWLLLQPLRRREDRRT